MDNNNRTNRDLFEHIQGLMSKGLVAHSSGRKYYTGYSYSTLYDWDQYFEGIVQLYMGYGTEYLQNSVCIFLEAQQKNGFIPRYVPNVPQTTYPQMDGEMVKPFLAQITLLCLKFDGGLKWFTSALYQRMKEYLLYWIGPHSVNGYAFYRSAPHSGLDTQTERCGGWEADFCGGIDLNVFLYRDLIAFSIIAEHLDKKQDQAVFTQYASEYRDKILDCWVEKDGFFYDRNVRTGNPIKVKTLAGMLPMWAGIATASQAQILTYDYLFNPEEFFRPYPFPAMSSSEPGYSETPISGDIGICNWRANTWIPTNYMVMHGLMEYGFYDLAELTAYKTAQLLAKSQDREFYDTESGKGDGLNPFWGWSLLGYFMPMEAFEDFDPTDLELDTDDMYAYMPYFRLGPDVGV